MVLGGAITTALLTGLLRRHRSWRAPALGLLAVGAAFSILAQMSIGTTAEAYVHRGDSLVRYLSWQHDVSPGAQAGLVRQVDGLPTGGSTDDLAIRGDCDALYLNTGDQYQPWVPVEERDRVLQLDPTGRSSIRGASTLLRVTGTDPQSVRVEVNHRQQLRFVTRLRRRPRPDAVVRPADVGRRPARHPQPDRARLLPVRGDPGRPGRLPAVGLLRPRPEQPAGPAVVHRLEPRVSPRSG